MYLIYSLDYWRNKFWEFYTERGGGGGGTCALNKIKIKFRETKKKNSISLVVYSCFIHYNEDSYYAIYSYIWQLLCYQISTVYRLVKVFLICTHHICIQNYYSFFGAESKMNL